MIFVIGSGSFSGQDFVDLSLTLRKDVFGVNRSEKKDVFLKYKTNPNIKNFSQLTADLNKDMQSIFDAIDATRPEVIVNFAAQSEVGPSWEHPEHWYQTNTVAHSRLVNFLRKKDFLKRYIHISSPEIYGTCVGTVYEDHPHNPSTPYAASKSAADWINAVYHKQYGFPVITVRSTNVYGPRQQLFKIIPKTILSIFANKKIPLHGGGNAVKSYIHIRDISRGTFDILEYGNVGEIYHLSPNTGVSVKSVVRSICNNLEVKFEDFVEIVEDRPGQDAAYVIDSSKVRNQTEWRPAILLQDGIKETIDWVDDNYNELKKYPFEYIHRL